MNKTEFNGLTEFKNKLSANDIKIWIYTMPVKDLNSKHNENYKIISELKKCNPLNQIIVFNEYLIAAFEEINSWGDSKYIKVEHRNIDISNSTERKILERLLLEEIRYSVDISKYEYHSNTKSVLIKIPVFQNEKIIVKRKFNFDINVEQDSNIIIGFSLSHAFDYKNTLDKEISINNIVEGELVKDFYNNSTYKFKQIAPFTINEKNEYMQCSIIDYYNNKKQSYIVEKLDKNTKAILVETNKGAILPYIPNRLKKVCKFENLSGNTIKNCNKYIKLKSHDRMKISIDSTVDILSNCKHIKFNKINMLIENLGYEKQILYKPKFKFGKENLHNTILYGLPQHGSYENKEIEISYFIDPNINKDMGKFNKVRGFANDLEKLSQTMGVKVKRISTYIEFNDIKTENKDVFELDLREIVEKYKNPAIVIMEDYNSQKYYNSVKKIFGNKNNIATQVIELPTLNYNEKNKNAVLLNILLGIYAKSGVQPWVLHEPLSADCFVGLDVSRENKLNTAGVIQVIGKDGRVLRCKSITSPQTGEKINIETIKEIFQEATYSYKKTYGIPPKHIVFHRDGITREELDLLKETAENLNIKFDYIEITKNVKRRMATLNNENKWETSMGVWYKKDNKAYLVTTNPYESIGMAQPIRIKKVYGDQSIDTIVKDVYKLSFMHIGSIIKSRLPVTTHYADLSSTFGNRELMPSNIDSNSLHFI